MVDDGKPGHSGLASPSFQSSPSSPSVRSRVKGAELIEVHSSALDVLMSENTLGSLDPWLNDESRLQSQKSHVLPISHIEISHALMKRCFAVWFLFCGFITVAALRSTDVAHTELFYIYYQPLLPVLTMLWLWGINVRYFERCGVRYDVCFAAKDQKYLLNSRQIFQSAGLATTVALTSSAVFCMHCWLQQDQAASLHPPLMYACILALVLLPWDVAFKETRMFFSTTLFRVATPYREMSWADFLLADILTSLAKPLSDCERALCHLISGPVMLPDSTDQMCGSSSWIIPAGLSLPYVWRLCQCLRTWRDTGNTGQAFNALKYSTAFPVIILSAVNFQVSDEDWNKFWKPLWLAAAFLNSAYSYYWDIERDWEIAFFTSPSDQSWMGLKKPVLKDKLQYSRAFYVYLMMSNLALRLAWTYKLSPHLRQNLLTVLMFTLLEVFRRFQWIFVRIEVELRKLQVSKPELGQLIPAPPPKDILSADELIPI